jgi:hypothetical protein
MNVTNFENELNMSQFSCVDRRIPNYRSQCDNSLHQAPTTVGGPVPC